jgi:hypothetical protein
MRVSVAWLTTALAISVVAWAVWLFLLWQPARQIELHTRNLLARASARDWPAVEAMMAPDYRDAWNGDRLAAIDEARRIFSHFFALQIVPLESPRIAGGAGNRSASAPLGIFGSGTAIAHEIMDEARDVKGPFELRWRKNGPWPWQWVLAEVRHEEFEGRWGR